MFCFCLVFSPPPQSFEQALSTGEQDKKIVQPVSLNNDIEADSYIYI